MEARARELAEEAYANLLGGRYTRSTLDELTHALTTIAREAREAALREAVKIVEQHIHAAESAIDRFKAHGRGDEICSWERKAARFEACAISEALEALIPAKGAEHE